MDAKKKVPKGTGPGGPVRAKFTPDMKELMECAPSGSRISVVTRDPGMVIYLIKLRSGLSMAAANDVVRKIQDKFRGRARSCSPSVEGLEATVRVRLADRVTAAVAHAATALTQKSRLMIAAMAPWQRRAVKAVYPHLRGMQVESVDRTGALLRASSGSLPPAVFLSLVNMGVKMSITAVTSKEFRIDFCKST